MGVGEEILGRLAGEWLRWEERRRLEGENSTVAVILGGGVGGSGFKGFKEEEEEGEDGGGGFWGLGLGAKNRDMTCCFCFPIGGFLWGFESDEGGGGGGRLW